MKKIYLYLPVLFVPVVLLLLSFSTGSPGGKSGSPGDGFNNCTDCHTGNPAISQAGWITSDIPESGYIAGEEYTITATGVHEGVVKFGFELTAEDALNAKTGDFIILDTRTQLANAGNAVTHTAQGNTPSGNSNTWEMNWIAPSEGTGNVTFYAAFNAANGNGNNQGDQIYLSDLSVKEATLSVADLMMDDVLRLYPNPATSFVNVEMPAGSEVRIIDLQGREALRIIPSTDEMQLDISSLPKGIYFVHVSNGDQATSRKLLKN